MMIEETRSKERERKRERSDYGNNAEHDDSRGVNGESFGAEEASSTRVRETRWPRKKLVVRRERRSERKGKRRRRMKTESGRAQQPKRCRGRSF